jgi:hypothetical protein
MNLVQLKSQVKAGVVGMTTCDKGLNIRITHNVLGF